MNPPAVAQSWPKRLGTRSRSHAAFAGLGAVLARMVAGVRRRRSPLAAVPWLASQAKGRGFEPRRPLLAAEPDSSRPLMQYCDDKCRARAYRRRRAGLASDDFQSPQLRGSAPLGVMSRAEEQAWLRAEMLTVRRRVA